MDSARYLLPEDRPDYERVLDEALRRVRHNTQLTSKEHFNTEQLRNITMDAVPLVAPRAAVEYQRYLELRTRLRLAERPRADRPLRDRARSGTSPLEDERTGAGILVVISVMLPVLAGISAAVFLLFGYGLQLADPEPAVAGAMRTAGWVFAILTAAGLLVAAAELVVTAMRNSPSVRAGRPVPGPAGLADEVDLARDTWHRALLEQGIIPFLRDALEDRVDDANETADGRGDAKPAESRTPRLRFSSPRYSSPGERPKESGSPPEEGPRFINPSFSSPRFSSRDEEREGSEGRSRFSSPRFSSPAEYADDSPRSSAPGFASPSYRAPEGDTETGSRYGSRGFASPAYQTPGERAEEESGPGGGGGSFGSHGYASPSFQTPDEDEESGSRLGSRGFASPRLASDRDEERDQPGGRDRARDRDGDEERDGDEPGSHFGSPGFASPKLAGSHDEGDGPER